MVRAEKEKGRVGGAGSVSRAAWGLRLCQLEVNLGPIWGHYGANKDFHPFISAKKCFVLFI